MLAESPGEERVRTAELIGALCLATDLGMGFPFEHGLHETLIAMRLAERLRVDRETAAQTYYTSLLSHAGCSAKTHVAAEVFGGSMTENFNPLMYGSVHEVVVGLLRSLPDEGVTGLARVPASVVLGLVVGRRLVCRPRPLGIAGSGTDRRMGREIDVGGSPPRVVPAFGRSTRWIFSAERVRG